MDGNLHRSMTLPRASAPVSDHQSKRTWITLAWHPTEENTLVSSAQMGDIVLWDISASRPRSRLFSTGHQRTVFSFSFEPHHGEYALTTSLDRQIVQWHLKTLKMKWSIPSLGGFVYHIDVSPHEADRLAIAVGDNTIRLWNLVSTSNPYDCQLLWKGLQSKVTMVLWHPRNVGELALGTEDGRVGLYDISGGRAHTVAAHRGQVMDLAWIHRDAEYVAYVAASLILCKYIPMQLWRGWCGCGSGHKTIGFCHS